MQQHEIQGFMVMKVFLASPANIGLISRHVQSNRLVNPPPPLYTITTGLNAATYG